MGIFASDICVNQSIYLSISVQIYIYKFVGGRWVSLCIYVCIYIYIYACLCLFIYIYIYISLCSYLSINLSICSYLFIYLSHSVKIGDVLVA